MIQAIPREEETTARISSLEPDWGENGGGGKEWRRVQNFGRGCYEKFRTNNKSNSTAMRAVEGKKGGRGDLGKGPSKKKPREVTPTPEKISEIKSEGLWS